MCGNLPNPNMRHHAGRTAWKLPAAMPLLLEAAAAARDTPRRVSVVNRELRRDLRLTTIDFRSNHARHLLAARSLRPGWLHKHHSQSANVPALISHPSQHTSSVRLVGCMPAWRAKADMFTAGVVRRNEAPFKDASLWANKRDRAAHVHANDQFVIDGASSRLCAHLFCASLSSFTLLVVSGHCVTSAVTRL
jgi:hypothetical protein